MSDHVPAQDEARALCLTGVQALVQAHMQDPRTVALIVAVAVEDVDGYVAEVATAIGARDNVTPAAAAAAEGALHALAESALVQVREENPPPRPPGNADPSSN